MSPTPTFESDVMEKLGRMEAKIDSLCGNGQPGRMHVAEDRITALEKNDFRRTWIERIITAVIATCVSAAIALHDHWFK